jgi:hypothetical protein
VALTRKEFYDLAQQCRTYASELANHEPTRVSLRHCHEFNAWLAKVKSYDQLSKPLASLAGARPVARWQVMTLAAVVALLLLMATAGRVDRGLSTTLFYGCFFSLIILFFVPERLYGTTVEMLEAKVLRVVDALDALLFSRELGLTEAAFFRAKENLEAARRELREQIDIVHRRF